MCRATVALIALVVTCALVPAAADIVTVYTDADAYIYEANGGSNYGSSSWLSAGQQFVGGESRTLMNFDTSSAVPNGLPVVSVTLHTTRSAWVMYAGPDSVIAVFEVGATWNESTVTWSSRPTTGSQVGTDLVVVDGAAPTEVTWDVTDAWAETSTLDFYLAMTNPGSGLGIYQPYSRESGGGANRAYLEIDYIPEPCSLALVGLGLGALILKRRREA